MPLVSLSRRIVGVLVDGIIFASVAVLCVWAGVFGRAAARTDWLEPDDWLPLIESGALWAMVIGIVLLCALLHGLIHGLTGSSPGKLLMGATVLYRDGSPSPRRLAARSALAGVGALLCFVGPAWILLTPRQRALHDLLVGTRVGRPE